MTLKKTDFEGKKGTLYPICHSIRSVCTYLFGTKKFIEQKISPVFNINQIGPLKNPNFEGKKGTIFFSAN